MILFVLSVNISVSYCYILHILGGAAYDIISANIEYIPSGHYVDIESQKEEDAFRKLVDLLNENEMVTGVYHNCSIDTAN